MKRVLSTGLLCLFLSACGGGSSNSDEQASNNDNSSDSSSENSELPSKRLIETLDDFTKTIVNKTLVLIAEDGTRIEESQVVVDDIKVTGQIESGGVDLDWYWENGAFCRSGVSGLPDDPSTVELECQQVDVDADIVTFTRERGTGEVASRWYIE